VATGLSPRQAVDRQRAAYVASGALAAALIVGCGIGASSAVPVTFPPQAAGPSAPITGAVTATRAAIAAALGGARLQLRDPQVAFRPPEAPRFAAAPRTVVQAVLPNDPQHGFISIYEFADPSAALDAGREQADYIASGPGRVQFPPDSRFVIRQLGPTVVFFSWSPGSVTDARAGDIQTALETVGQGIAVPS
jgi:hypothetical protein